MGCFMGVVKRRSRKSGGNDAKGSRNVFLYVQAMSGRMGHDGKDSSRLAEGGTQRQTGSERNDSRRNMVWDAVITVRAFGFSSFVFS